MNPALETMTQAKWSQLSAAERDAVRDLSSLTPQLVGLEGCRVEVTDKEGRRRRFIVGKSTGWRPCHLEIKTKRSSGGMCADAEYASVKSLGKVR